MIPYGRQSIDQSDIDAVTEVLKSDFLTCGPKVPEFEKAFSSYCGAKLGIAANSATSSLHAACLALGVGKGDIVWTTPITFVASSNCALYCGADVDFVDIDSSTYNMSVVALEEKLKTAKRLPKVVIPVHLSGQSCDMKRIHELALKYNFKVIEDASHCAGGSYLGKHIGCCEYSDITVFSFHPVKIMTTAEGGICLTNNEDLARDIRLFVAHAITRDESMMKNKSHGPWYYEQIGLGFNYRMTELQAALGISQLKRVDQFVTRRHEIADRYNRELADLPLTLPHQLEGTYSAYHLYIVRLKLDKISKTHLEVFNELRAKGIGVNLHYIPVYKQPYYQEHGFKGFTLTNAEQYYKEAFSIPMYQGLTDEQQSEVIRVLKEVLCKR